MVISNIVRAEFLNSTTSRINRVPLHFSRADIPNRRFHQQKGKQIFICLQRNACSGIFFRNTVVDLTLAKVESPRPSEPQPPVRTVWNGGHRFKPKGKPRGKRKRETTNDDLKQFGSSASAQSEFCSTLRPVVKRLAREGTRKPGDVALRLNHEGIKTASGGQWTPHLAQILLGFIFDKNNAQEGKWSQQTSVEGARR